MVIEAAQIEDLPRIAGAYMLAVDLLRPAGVANGAVLDPGRYVYCGSAKGPGGIGARLARHAKPAKAVRWHIDVLTNTAGIRWALALPGGEECAAVGACAALAGVSVPAPGFGASDCRRCTAHLLAVPDDFEPVQALAAETLAALAPAGSPVSWHCPPAACFWRPPPGRGAP